MNYVTVDAEFDFVSALDGSKHTVRTFGEAMDSADKATNKAMSAAYKYAAFQAFAIPTEGDNDADAHTPQSVAKHHAKMSVVAKALSDAGKTDAWLLNLANEAGWPDATIHSISDDKQWCQWALDMIKG